MRKITIFVIIFAAVILSGCANDNYQIEKRYYRLQKQVSLIFKNPEVSPKKELDRSVNALNNFIKKYPENKLVLDAEFTIARLYIVKKEYEKARSQLNNMLAKYSSSEEICSEIIFLKGNSYEIQDKWGAANAQYQKIIQQYPVTVRGLSTPVYVAQHYKIKYAPDLMNAAYQEAIAHYNVLINNYPNSKLGYMLLQLVTQSYLEIKDWQGAANTLNSMLANYKDKVEPAGIMLSLANIYSQKLQNSFKATEILETLIKEYPKSKLTDNALKLLKELQKK